MKERAKMTGSNLSLYRWSAERETFLKKVLHLEVSHKPNIDAAEWRL